MARLRHGWLSVSALALLWACQATAAPAGDRLTPERVRSLIGAMETATRNGDARTATSFMADDCVITTTFPARDGGRRTSIKDKRKYLQDEAEAARQHSARDYTSTAPAIDIDASGKVARASYKATETYVKDGRKVQVTGYEIATVEWRGGEPAVTAIDVDAVRMTIDDRQIF